MLNKHKILLADDEPQNIKILYKVLDEQHYEILAVPNGKIAVEQALEHLPDAIIMDWDMPVMDGLEAIRVIREKKETQNIPIIVATGKMTSTEHLRIALEAGANDYIRKPYDPIEIEARIKSMIRLHLEHKKNIHLQKEISQQKIDFLNQELETNRQALSAIKLRMLYNSSSISTLIRDLAQLSTLVTEEGELLVGKMISKCKSDFMHINWEEFEVLFEKVHPVFYSNLRNLNPDLNNNERRLAAFLRLNMSTKEISAITKLQYHSIKKSKQRLKRKLGLSGEEMLYKTLQEI